MEESPIHVPVFHTHARAGNSRYAVRDDSASFGGGNAQVAFLTSYFTGAPSEVGAPGSLLTESFVPRQRTARV